MFIAAFLFLELDMKRKSSRHFHEFVPIFFTITKTSYKPLSHVFKLQSIIQFSKDEFYADTGFYCNKKMIKSRFFKLRF